MPTSFHYPGRCRHLQPLCRSWLLDPSRVPADVLPGVAPLWAEDVEAAALAVDVSCLQIAARFGETLANEDPPQWPDAEDPTDSLRKQTARKSRLLTALLSLCVELKAWNVRRG